MIKCQACGKRYDYYEHGCCPECGAYNRPPHRNRVGVDGVVHHMSDTDFLENSHKRRNSQGGKVCFERDVCFEDQVRKTRGSAAKGGRKKSNPAKIITIVIIVIMVTNILPILLTMCSVSGVFEEIIDEVFGIEMSVSIPEGRPTTVDPDEPSVQVVAVGETFIWWEQEACVIELSMNEGDWDTEVDLTMLRKEAFDEPTIRYYLPAGTEVDAFCESVENTENDLYTYSYWLTDRLPGSECWVVLTGYNGNDYCEVKIPLN
jgi:hypothetical protein